MRTYLQAVVAALFLLLAGEAPAQAATGSTAAGSATVTGTVTLEPMEQPPVGAHYRGRTRAPILDPEPPRAIVYLVSDDGRYPAERRDGAISIRQKGYQFRPAVAAVQVGGEVTFPNRDDEFHNVFSYSPVKRFDLGRYRKGEETPPVTFDEPGVVRVYCEIHKHMRALLLVLETPWFTATDHQGRFELSGVPAGRYSIRAFLPSEKTLESRVTLPPGGSVRVDMTESAHGP